MKILLINNCDDCKYEMPVYDNCGDLIYYECNKTGRTLKHKTWCTIPDDCPLEDVI